MSDMQPFYITDFKILKSVFSALTNKLMLTGELYRPNEDPLQCTLVISYTPVSYLASIVDIIQTVSLVKDASNMSLIITIEGQERPIVVQVLSVCIPTQDNDGLEDCVYVQLKLSKKTYTVYTRDMNNVKGFMNADIVRLGFVSKQSLAEVDIFPDHALHQQIGICFDQHWEVNTAYNNQKQDTLMSSLPDKELEISFVFKVMGLNRCDHIVEIKVNDEQVSPIWRLLRVTNLHDHHDVNSDYQLAYVVHAGRTMILRNHTSELKQVKVHSAICVPTLNKDSVAVMAYTNVGRLTILAKLKEPDVAVFRNNMLPYDVHLALPSVDKSELWLTSISGLSISATIVNVELDGVAIEQMRLLWGILGSNYIYLTTTYITGKQQVMPASKNDLDVLCDTLRNYLVCKNEPDAVINIDMTRLNTWIKLVKDKTLPDIELAWLLSFCITVLDDHPKKEHIIAHDFRGHWLAEQYLSGPAKGSFILDKPESLEVLEVVETLISSNTI